MTECTSQEKRLETQGNTQQRSERPRQTDENPEKLNAFHKHDHVQEGKKQPAQDPLTKIEKSYKDKWPNPLVQVFPVRLLHPKTTDRQTDNHDIKSSMAKRKGSLPNIQVHDSDR